MSATEAPDSLLGHIIDPRVALPAWLSPHTTRLLARREAFPHALLLSGGAGAALDSLAEALAAGLLCDAPLTDGAPCGDCAACRLLAAGTHPDLLWLSPAEADEDAGRKASSQIRIEAVRQLIGTLALRPHHGATRVSVIDPAEAMNAATANALLKVLEEPPPGNVLLLLSLRPLRLLPTLRSRCLQLRVVRPEGVGWAAAVGDGSVDAPENGSSGTVDPALAELAAFLRDPAPEAAARAVWPAQRALLDALARGARLGVPAAARTAGLTLPAALDVLSRWVHDLARVQAGGTPRFLPGRATPLAKVAAEADRQGLMHMGARLAEWQRHANHPLLASLTVADILLEYRAELFPAARAA
ncbi:MAG: DNA polymerase III subunit delta' [Rhodocyclaceae bacterium]|nr:DNA polymerase III subunit delta' [Rhodocyclaceae bacterium]